MAFRFNGLLGLSPKEVPKKLLWSQFALSAQFFVSREQSHWRASKAGSAKWKPKKHSTQLGGETGRPWPQWVRLQQSRFRMAGSLSDGAPRWCVCHWRCTGQRIGPGRAGGAPPSVSPRPSFLIILLLLILFLSSVNKCGSFFSSLKIWAFIWTLHIPVLSPDCEADDTSLIFHGHLQAKGISGESKNILACLGILLSISSGSSLLRYEGCESVAHAITPLYIGFPLQNTGFSPSFIQQLFMCYWCTASDWGLNSMRYLTSKSLVTQRNQKMAQSIGVVITFCSNWWGSLGTHQKDSSSSEEGRVASGSGDQRCLQGATGTQADLEGPSSWDMQRLRASIPTWAEKAWRIIFSYFL